QDRGSADRSAASGLWTAGKTIARGQLPGCNGCRAPGNTRRAAGRRGYPCPPQTHAKAPELFTPGLRLDCPGQSGLGVARHEVVISDLGDLEPLVTVAGKRVQRFQDLLEIGVRGRDLAVQFSRRLE